MSIKVQDVNALLMGAVASACFLAVTLLLIFVCWHYVETAPTPQLAIDAIKGLAPAGGGAFVVVLTACTTVMRMLLKAQKAV